MKDPKPEFKEFHEGKIDQASDFDYFRSTLIDLLISQSPTKSFISFTLSPHSSSSPQCCLGPLPPCVTSA